MNSPCYHLCCSIAVLSPNRRSFMSIKHASMFIMWNWQEKIGWRNKARRMVIYATDINFHYAGDGRVSQQIRFILFKTLISVLKSSLIPYPWRKFSIYNVKHLEFTNVYLILNLNDNEKKNQLGFNNDIHYDSHSNKRFLKIIFYV